MSRVQEFRVLEAYSPKDGVQILIPKHLESSHWFRGFGVPEADSFLIN